MTANDESLQGTFVSDGTIGTVDSVTVPDGEVWYIDSFHAISDGTGSTDGTFSNVKVGDSSVLDTIKGESLTTANSANLSPADNAAGGDSSAIEEYAASGEEIRVVKTQDPDSGATFSYSVTIRRIA